MILLIAFEDTVQAPPPVSEFMGALSICELIPGDPKWSLGKKPNQGKPAGIYWTGPADLQFFCQLLRQLLLSASSSFSRRRFNQVLLLLLLPVQCLHSPPFIWTDTRVP